MRSQHGSQDVVGRAAVRHPVPHRLVDGVLESTASRRDGDDPRAQQPHPHHVQRLAGHVLLPHVDYALQIQQCRHRGAGHAMLPRPGLGDDPPLPHPPRQQCLSHGVVDLVGAGMVQVFPLEVNPCASQGFFQLLGTGERGGTSDVVPEEPVQFRLKGRIDATILISLLQLQQGGHERLGDIPAAVAPIPPPSVRARPHAALPSTATRNASMRRRSFTPGRDSIPELTSTA